MWGVYLRLSLICDNYQNLTCADPESFVKAGGGGGMGVQL